MKQILLAAGVAAVLLGSAASAQAGWCYNGYRWVQGYYWGHSCMAGAWHPYRAYPPSVARAPHPPGPGYYWGNTWMPGPWHPYAHQAYHGYGYGYRH